MICVAVVCRLIGGGIVVGYFCGFISSSQMFTGLRFCLRVWVMMVGDCYVGGWEKISRLIWEVFFWGFLTVAWVSSLLLCASFLPGVTLSVLIHDCSSPKSHSLSSTYQYASLLTVSNPSFPPLHLFSHFTHLKPPPYSHKLSLPQTLLPHKHGLGRIAHFPYRKRNPRHC